MRWQRQGSIGAVQELHRHKLERRRADIFEVVQQEFALGEGEMARLSGPVLGLLSWPAIDVGPGGAGRQRGSKVVQHMAVEADPLAGGDADVPDPHAVSLREQDLADAGVEFIARKLGPQSSERLGSGLGDGMAGMADMAKPFPNAGTSGMPHGMTFISCSCVK